MDTASMRITNRFLAARAQHVPLRNQYASVWSHIHLRNRIEVTVTIVTRNGQTEPDSNHDRIDIGLSGSHVPDVICRFADRARTVGTEPCFELSLEQCLS